MIPIPKMSTAAPDRWVSSVVLDPEDVEDLLHELTGSPLGDRLRATSQEADKMAKRLNKIEQPGKAE
jgi:hypothetical protein